MLGRRAIFTPSEETPVADVSVTTTAVAIDSDDTPGLAVLGAACVAGDALQYDAANSNWILATDAVAADVRVAVALASGSTGQTVPIAQAVDDAVTLGTGVLTAGGVYAVSGATAGKIAPVADLTTGDGVYLLGYASDADTLVLLLKRTGVTL